MAALQWIAALLAALSSASVSAQVFVPAAAESVVGAARTAALDPGVRVLGKGQVDVDMGQLLLSIRVRAGGDSNGEANAALERRLGGARERLHAVMGPAAAVRSMATVPDDRSASAAFGFAQFGMIELTDTDMPAHSVERGFAISAAPSPGESLLAFTARAHDAVAGMDGVSVAATRYLPSNAAAAERRALAAAVSHARSRASLLGGFMARELGGPIEVDARSMAAFIPPEGFEHPGTQRLTLWVPIRFALLDKK